MADYHILDNRPDGNELRVVFHLPVPDADNDGGLNYRTALVQYLGDEQTSILSATLLGAGEQDLLNTGALYEHVWRQATNPNLTLTQKRDALDAQYTQFASAVITQLQARLQFWGYSRDVP